MSWGDTIYCQFPDRETGVAFGAQLGIEFPVDGSIPSGNHNFALVEMQAPWAVEPTYDEAGEVVTPGEREPGWWCMGRINDAWPGAAGALAAIEAAGVRKHPDPPPMVWA